MKLTRSIVVVVAAGLPLVAWAGNPGFHQRQAHREARIHQGIHSGELTRGEFRRLEAEQRHIRNEARAYRSDGQLSGWERHDLRREQRAASRDIYRQKHDGQERAHPGNPAVRDPWVNARQHEQHARIAQGVRSGELTREEAQGLRTTQQSIRAEERSYKSDGKLTRDERKDLHQDLNAASRDIYLEKHDAEKRD